MIVDGTHHKMLVSTCRRNPACRFDHRNWAIHPWLCAPRATGVWSAIASLGAFHVDGHRFVTRLTCPGCGAIDSGLKLNRPRKLCPHCGRRMVIQNFDTIERLDGALPQEYRGLTLEQIGLRAGDVITCGDRHFNLSEAA